MGGVLLTIGWDLPHVSDKPEGGTLLTITSSAQRRAEGGTSLTIRAKDQGGTSLTTPAKDPGELAHKHPDAPSKMRRGSNATDWA